MNDPTGPDIAALTAAVAKNLGGLLQGLPGLHQPDAELPPVLWDPPTQRPDDLLPKRQLAIAGVELTQSIQFNGAVGTSYGIDNSIPLVALKTLVARVYPFVRPGLAAPDALTGVRITGELVLSVGDRVVYRTGPTSRGGVRVGSRADLSRTLWDEELTGVGAGPAGSAAVRLLRLNPSLNFVVPAWYCPPGRFFISVRLWREGTDGFAAPQDAASTAQYIEFLDVRPPRVCLVRVNWADSTGTVAALSDDTILATTRVAERMLPFPYFESTILGMQISSTAAFATVATSGGCNAAWNRLLTDLAVTRIFTTLFQLGDIVFGFVPNAAIPATAKTINSGCGVSTGVGGAFAGFNFSFAHEMGHIFTCAHVAVPGDATSDPNYPNYGGSKTSIGEVGIDTGAVPPTLFSPSDTGDIMSYKPKQWISPYTYMKILDARDIHQSAPADPRRVRSLLIVVARVHRRTGAEGRIEIRHAHRIEAPGVVPRPAGDVVSPLSVDLLDAHREIIATHHCLYAQAEPGVCSCGCGAGASVPLERQPFYDLHEVLEWPGDEVTAIAFHDGRATLGTVEVGEAPRVEITGPERREQSLAVMVHAHHPRENPSVVVLFSADDGVTWQPVGFDPADGQVLIDAERLPGGERCLFRAIATAELRSATVDTGRFELSGSRRRIYLQLPDDRCGIRPGPVALSAYVDTRGLGAVLPNEIRWYSSLEGELGAGYDLIAILREGRHEITVASPDGRGGTLSERGIIIVSGQPISRERT
jgi:hypothetical protein